MLREVVEAGLPWSLDHAATLTELASIRSRNDYQTLFGSQDRYNRFLEQVLKNLTDQAHHTRAYLILQALAHNHATRGNLHRAIVLYEAQVATERTRSPKTQYFPRLVSEFADYLEKARRFPEAEGRVREYLGSVAQTQHYNPTHVQMRLALGRLLRLQTKFAAAEVELTELHRSLESQPANITQTPGLQRAVVEELARLYEDWGKPAEAAKWRGEVVKYPPERSPIPRLIRELAPPPRAVKR